MTPQALDLDCERARLERLRREAEAAQRRADSYTGDDPAVVSGLRRRPSRRADARRWASYDRAAAASRAVQEQERRIKVEEVRLERAARDAAAPRDLDALAAGWFVRDRHGWHRVVRVNAKTVSIETGYSWVDRISKGRIVETRAPKQVAP